MVDPKLYYNLLNKNGIEFFVGVPDSSLKYFTSFISDHLKEEDHIIATNEGASIGIAAGYHMAKSKLALVYMQNSGMGNAINPLLSLADEKVYQIPMILMIGWRGEPGTKDEPQHKKQGEITLALLECMGIPYIILDSDEETALAQTKKIIAEANQKSIPHAIVVKPSTFKKYKLKSKIQSQFELSREEALKIVVNSMVDNDIVISTTGKLSRELFEYREALNQTHENDFLTVGSMGHSSSIALGIAIQKKDRRVFCLDGDGSILMHTGSLSVIGKIAPPNFYHILFNNGAHESVGGQPTVGFDVQFTKVAEGYLYKTVISIESKKELENTLNNIENMPTPVLIEIKVGIDSRENLGRPTISPVQNKNSFIKNLK